MQNNRLHFILHIGFDFTTGGGVNLKSLPQLQGHTGLGLSIEPDSGAGYGFVSTLYGDFRETLAVVPSVLWLTATVSSCSCLCVYKIMVFLEAVVWIWIL